MPLVTIEVLRRPARRCFEAGVSEIRDRLEQKVVVIGRVADAGNVISARSGIAKSASGRRLSRFLSQTAETSVKMTSAIFITNACNASCSMPDVLSRNGNNPAGGTRQRRLAWVGRYKDRLVRAMIDMLEIDDTGPVEVGLEARLDGGERGIAPSSLHRGSPMTLRSMAAVSWSVVGALYSTDAPHPTASALAPASSTPASAKATAKQRERRTKGGHQAVKRNQWIGSRS